MRRICAIMFAAIQVFAFSQEDLKISEGLGSINGPSVSRESAALDDFDIIFKQDMESATLGPYIKEEWKRDWNSPPWSTRLSETTIVEKDGSKVFKWIYPEGAVGSSSSGGQWETPIPGDFCEEIYMSYNVMFRPGFDFVLAGKLPGLAGGPDDWNAGEEKPHWDSGWLCGLLMKGQSDPRGYIAFYPYHQDQTSFYGDSYHWLNPYSTDDLYYIKDDNESEKWINITIRIVMNTVSSDGSGGNNDGILEGFIDGKLMVQYTNMRFRNLATIGIDRMKVYSFFGGNTEAFAARRDEWALFDDFYLFTMKDGVSAPKGNTPSEEGRDLGIPWLKKGVVVDPDTDPPTVPENLSVLAITNNSISISWDPSIDNIGVAGYKIYVNNSLYTSIEGTSHEVLNLTSGEEYTFSVSAFDKAGNESAESISIGAFTSTDTEPPSIPSGIALTRVTSNSLEFKWQPSTDNVGVDHYEIRLNDIYEDTTASIDYAATDLAPNSTYTITIRAFDKNGNASPFSNGVSRTTEVEAPEVTDNIAPSTPTGLNEHTVTSRSIKLSWNPSTDNVEVIGYKIYLNNDPKGESQTNSTTVEDLLAGLSYNISVSAFDQAGNESEKSKPIEVTTVNNDFTTNPTLPEVRIVDLQTNNENVGSVSEVESLGYTEVEDYGIMVTRGTQSVEEGEPIFAGKSLTEVESKGRITEGLQLLYNFSDKDGSKVSEISGAGEAIDLHINHPLNTDWLPGQGLKVTGNTILTNENTPSRLLDALVSTNEISLEAWISQSETKQSNPASILSLSSGGTGSAFTLGQKGDEISYNYSVDLLTASADLDSISDFATSIGFTSQSLHHVVYTRQNNGTEKIYVNGIELSSDERIGEFSNWAEDYQIVLGNELNGEQPWNGIFYLVAIYNQALSEEDVLQNYESGFGTIRYSTNLSDLMPNTTYKLYPFVRTDQGIVYGEKKSFLIENVLFSEEEDSLYMAVYPNPSSGEFKLHVEYENTVAQPTFLRIANMSGQFIYGRELSFNDEYVNTDISINLSSQIEEGMYSVILIVGTSAVAQRLIIHR